MHSKKTKAERNGVLEIEGEFFVLIDSFTKPRRNITSPGDDGFGWQVHR